MRERQVGEKILPGQLGRGNPISKGSTKKGISLRDEIVLVDRKVRVLVKLIGEPTRPGWTLKRG